MPSFFQFVLTKSSIIMFTEICEFIRQVFSFVLSSIPTIYAMYWYSAGFYYSSERIIPLQKIRTSRR